MKAVAEQIKSTTRDQAARMAEKHASEVARYLTAAWRFQVRNRKEPKWSVNDQAKQEKIETSYLGKVVEFLKKSLPALMDGANCRPTMKSRRQPPARLPEPS